MDGLEYLTLLINNEFPLLNEFRTNSYKLLTYYIYIKNICIFLWGEGGGLTSVEFELQSDPFLIKI